MAVSAVIVHVSCCLIVGESRRRVLGTLQSLCGAIRITALPVSLVCLVDEIFTKLQTTQTFLSRMLYVL